MTSPRCAAVAATALAALATAAPAHAWQDRAPLDLPPAGAHAARATGAQTWIVGARDTRAARAIARRAGARPRRAAGTYTIATARARALGTALRRAGLLRYAEPNRIERRASAPESDPGGWARGAVLPPTLPPPAPGNVSLAIVDDPIDPAVADVGAQTTWLNGRPTGKVSGPHGTEVASAAAGAVDGQGVVGIYPGLPLLSYGLPPNITCADTADGILAAAEAKARVINLSLGGASDCFSLFVAVQRAYAAGSLVVASGGNDFLQGNPVVYPAAYPHVLSVAAVDESLHWADFSNANVAIDLAAPGVDVPVALPPGYDTEDGVQDGLTLADGTSFAAPIVAGSAAWLAAARPNLSNGQLADVLRHSARDLEAKGYDALTGYGLVNVPAALALRTPKTDPLEPNDGITWVDGTAFNKPDPRVWNGHGSHTISASVDAVEDPIDVYRIRVPRHAAFSVVVRPSLGDPDLLIYSSKAKSVSDTGLVIDASRRKGAGRTESAHLVNRSGRARSAYVAVRVSDSTNELASIYKLQLKRTRRR